MTDFTFKNWIANMPQSKIDDAREKTLLQQVAKVGVRMLRLSYHRSITDHREGRR